MPLKRSAMPVSRMYRPFAGRQRDGAAGDGAGYRYPHAYAEHWVEQQYLPTALQGGFGSPDNSDGRGNGATDGGTPGGSARRGRGTAADQPLLLSSGPERPAWTLRSATRSGGERLQRLRERLWRNIPGPAGIGCCCWECGR